MAGVRGLGAWRYVLFFHDTPRYNADGTRWLFIIEGAATVAVALGAFFVMPNFPRTTTWLTEEEKAMAVWRLDEDIGTDDWVSSKQQSFLHGAVLAAK
jgi:hypothetical protein